MHEDLVIELRAIESYGSTEISSYDAGLYADAIEGMNEIINGLNETIKMYGKDAPCWVPVTPQLPKENEPCIVYNKYYGPLVGWRVDGERFRIPGSRFPDHPTHWMSLPQPPKEEQ